MGLRQIGGVGGVVVKCGWVKFKGEEVLSTSVVKWSGSVAG